MPRDYNIQSGAPTAHQRRTEYIRDDVWIRAFLHRGRVAHIGSLWDDQPFVTPSTYLFDEAQNRLIFHSNLTGRIRGNIERSGRVCVEVSELGQLVPSNVALEFSLQYRSVMVFGQARVLEDFEERRQVMHKLIAKYFPDMRPGREFRPITDQELKRTSVYEIAIEDWTGKENWKDRADQSGEWPALDENKIA
jgi:uncharacterized protein